MFRPIFSFFLIVAGIFFSCTGKNQKEFTDKDYARFADSLGFSMRTGDSAFFLKNLDLEFIEESFQKETGAGLLGLNEARKIIRTEIGFLANQIALALGEQNLKLIHQYKDSIGYHVIFRTFREQTGLNYVDVLLVSGENHPLIRDIAFFTNGGSYFKLLNETYAAVMVDQNSFIPGKEGLSWKSQGQLQLLYSIRKLMQNDHFEEAGTILKRIGPELRATRNFMICELQYTNAVRDSVLYSAVEKRINERFPNDPDLLLVKLEACFVNKQFKQAASYTEQLDKRVHDPLLNLIRGNIYASMDSIKQAEVYFQKAIATAENEYRPNCYGSLLIMYIKNNNAKESIRVANAMIEQASYDKEELIPVLLENQKLADDPEVRKWVSN